MCEITQIREHYKVKKSLAFDLSESSHSIYFQGKADKKCLEIRKEDIGYHAEASYYVGVDWVIESKQAFYIEPKLNNDSQNTDYLIVFIKNGLITKIKKPFGGFKFFIVGKPNGNFIAQKYFTRCINIFNNSLETLPY